MQDPSVAQKNKIADVARSMQGCPVLPVIHLRDCIEVSTTSRSPVFDNEI
ncbi:hypothetical protein MCOR11_010321 [Pyricularia oryzae]|nr:hypothetical protein MCOR11_010321 [Pyricularia oryzae]